MPTSAITRQTFRLELWRSLPTGVLDTLVTTFGLLIAVRVFGMSDFAKSFLLSSNSAGLMLSLVLIPILLRFRVKVSALAAFAQFAAAGCVVIAAAFPVSQVAYLGGIGGGLFFLAVQIPLMTTIYRLNYPDASRGRLYSLTGLTRAAAGIAFGFAGGWLLGIEIDLYRWLLWVFAVALVLSAVFTLRLPSQPMARMPDQPRSLISSLRWVKLDRDFRILLISWMLMGTGNLVAVALFVEYLANPKHGINLDEKSIAWIVGVTPVVFRLLFSYPWGLIYDKVNFFVVRSSLNVLFAAAILTFYHGQNLTSWVISMAIFGVANAGGMVTWSLWVTKLAPDHAVAEYMSVHTFFTGVRGILSPFFAFFLIGHFSFQTVATACAVAVLAASGLIAVRARGGDPESAKRLSPLL